VRRELDEDAYWLRGSTGFGFREQTEGSNSVNLFGGGQRTPRRSSDMDVPM
jgi:nitrate reductase beta subunit